jgi:hypothetical protein
VEVGNKEGKSRNMTVPRNILPRNGRPSYCVVYSRSGTAGNRIAMHSIYCVILERSDAWPRALVKIQL